MRIRKVCDWVDAYPLDALIIEDPYDLFYLTGLWFSVAQMVLCKMKAFLIVDGRYFEIAKEKLSHCEVLLSGDKVLGAILDNAHRVGFDSAFISVDRFEKLKSAAPSKSWMPIAKPLKGLRACKDDREIKALKQAASLTSQGYKHILQYLQEGVTEKQIAWEFEQYCRAHGASQLSFEPIVAFGSNSAYPHHRAGDAKLQRDQIVLLDLGAVVDDYRGDMTRVGFFGQAHPKLKYFYDLVKQAHDTALALVRPGLLLGELDRQVRSILAKESLEDLFTHGLGHGIGLQTHEYPFLRKNGEDRDLVLLPGMVFTIEPGLYLPGTGGVRYENTILVTETGAENFYAGL